MPLLRPALLLASLGVALASARGGMTLQSATPGKGATALAPSATPSALPGREDDARVARLVFRLATAGVARCAAPEPTPGLVLQHLTQFKPADRPGMIAALKLDRGPGVIAVAPDGPADRAGIRPGDVLLAIDGTALPREAALAAPFAAARAHARADTIADLLAVAGPLDLTLLRGDGVRHIRLTPLPACPSRVHLARSGQRNAYADGRHVFLTTGMLALLRNDDELAFIIAHEMAHNILGHAAIMRGATVRTGIGRTLGRSGQIVRGTETEADALGAEMMLDAGFDPVCGAAILTRLGGGDFGIALLATHEPAGKRLAAVAAIASARRPL